MICPHCGAKVANNKKFCGDCGWPLPWRCGVCSSENPPGKRFCGDCGAEVTGRPVDQRQSAGAPMGERRQLTVLFTDLVGSTALSARFDPEDLRELITSYHHTVTGIVARFGGFVARYMGDGVLVYFGYPQANEDDAERAVRAGLTIVEAVGHLSTIAGPRGTLTSRVGIATGVVVVGDLIGSGASLESPVVGEVPNLAARLQTVAEPGTIVIADSTRLLIGALFEYRNLGPSELKGLGSVHAWAVLGEGAIDSRYEALRPNQVPLVGREEELALLVQRWEQVKSGEGRVVLLSGEPGIGKSRLVAELEQRLTSTQYVRVRILCSPHYQDTPLHPIIRHLERAAGFQGEDAPIAKRDKLRHLLAHGASTDTEIALLAELLAIPGAVDDLPRTLTPRQRRETTQAAILRYFAGLARRGPLLVAVEDIHWADATTRELLDVQIETVEQSPILMIITTRPELQSSWATQPQVTVRLLAGLHRRHATILVKEVTGERTLPREVVERIIAHADGIPLFIEELTKTVLENGLLRQHSERQAPVGLPTIDVIPTSLQTSLLARLDRLADSKEVALVGSVIGRDFSFEMLRALSELPAKRLEDGLAQLVQTGLATVRGQPPFSTYIFKHALVQDAAYASLLRDRRRALHLRLAETLEHGTISGATVEPQLLAWHFGEAGVPDKSIDYYMKAAESATGRLALGEMVSHLRKGLRQLEYLPQSSAKLRRELDLQVALGHALIDHCGSGSEEVRAVFERARELCLELGDTKRLVVIFDGLVLNHHFTHSETTKMLRYTTELFEVAGTTGNPLALLWARRARSSANLLQGRFEEARREMQVVIDMYNDGQDASQDRQMARDPRVSTFTLFGICLTALGYPSSGASMSLEGLRHAEVVNHFASLNTGLRRASVQGMMQRDTHRVFNLADRLRALNTEHETFVGTREATIFRGWAQLHWSWEAELLHRVHACLEQLDAAKHWVMLPFFMTSLAEVIGQHGDHSGAVVLLDRVTELINLTGEQWSEAESIRLRALFGTRDPDEAITLLRASLAKAREQNAKAWELRAATSLAKLWCDQGKLAAARQVLAPVHAWFTEGSETPDVIAAQLLLDTLGREHT
jgi:class 3 adenylate cyclase